MNETKQQLTARKIRNGLRKQASKILREKEKIWDILKKTSIGSGATVVGMRREELFAAFTSGFLKSGRGIKQ